MHRGFMSGRETDGRTDADETCERHAKMIE